MTEQEKLDATICKFALFIQDLTDKELSLLNKMVVDRNKMMRKAKTLFTLSALKIGDTVRWQGKDGMTYRGTIIRLNHKTASVRRAGDDEGWWKISPQLLTKEI